MDLLTKKECKKILSSLGFKYGVSPKLLATRLLNDRDKGDMMRGDLTIESLECHIRVWMRYGMTDYSDKNVGQ